MLTTSFVSRILSPQEIGLFTVAMAVAITIQHVREFGIVSYVFQESAITQDDIRTVFAISLIVGWSLGLALFLARHFMAYFYGNPKIEDIVLMLSLSFAVFPFGLPATAMLRRERRFSDLAVVSTSASFVGCVVSCTLAFKNYGAISLAIGTFAGSVTQSMVALYFWPQHLKLWPSLKSWKKISKYGSQISLASLATSFGQSVPDLIVGKLMGLHETAILARGRVLPIVVDRLVTTPIQTATAPELATRMREGQDIRRVMLQVDQLTLMFSWSILSFLMINSAQVIELLYGKQWTGSAPILQAICISQAVQQLSNLPRVYLVAKGNARSIFRNEFIILILIVTTVMFATRWNLPILSWMLTIPASCTAIVYWQSAHNTLDYTRSDLISNWSLPLWLAVATVASQYLFNVIVVNYFVTSSVLGVLAVLALKLCVGLAISTALVRKLNPSAYNRILMSIRSRVIGGKQ